MHDYPIYCISQVYSWILHRYLVTYYQVHVNRLESIQKKFIRLLCLKMGIDYYHHSYNHLLQYFSMQRLERRRCYADLIFVFKALNNIITCPPICGYFTNYVPVRPLRRSPFLIVDFHRTNYGLNSSSTRISKLVNSVNFSQDTFDCSILSFKSLLRQVLFTWSVARQSRLSAVNYSLR